MRAVFRSHSRRICYQRAILHHAARRGSERRHTFRLRHLACGLLLWLWLLSRAAVMRTRRTHRITAFACFDRWHESSLRSTAIVVLLQPKRHPPAIQTDTLIETAIALLCSRGTNSLGWQSTPCADLSRLRLRIKIVIKFQHFCNG